MRNMPSRLGVNMSASTDLLPKFTPHNTNDHERTMSMNDRLAQSVESGCYPPLSGVLATFVEGAYRC